MKPYKIVQSVEGQYVVTRPTDIIAWANVAGVEITGTNANTRHRIEIQGQPILKGFAGPMWDGDCVRYEDTETNDHMSI